MDKNKEKNKTKKYILIKILIAILICVSGIGVFCHFRKPENKARRIADKYLKDEYGVSLESYEVTEGVAIGADYSVLYKLSDDSIVFVSVSSKKEKALYDNYVQSYILDKLNKAYREEIELIWDKQADVEFNGYLLFPEDKYLSQDKKIDYQRAFHTDEFELTICTETFNLEQSANAIYNSIVCLKEKNVKLSKIKYYDYSGERLKDYKHYILSDLDRFENSDMILEYLNNYKE